MWFHRRRRRWGSDHPHGRARISLAEAPPGSEVILLGYGQVDPAIAGSLRAYGLLPGRRVQVLAQQPVTIVQVEQTELALESQIARAVIVRLSAFGVETGSELGDQSEDCSQPSRSLSKTGRRRE